ncbi:MAG: M13 family metallopeptidase [Planctomycetota bacterium]|nr:M13 family metallopeptidase [Planctomycetota bacterium]
MLSGNVSGANPTKVIETTEKISGIDKSLFSSSVQPGDNFYLYANEKWLSDTEIPADKSNYGIFTLLADEADEQVRRLIELAAESEGKHGTASQKVGDLYRSVLNTEKRNQVGIDPLKEFVAMVDAIKSHEEAAVTMGTLSKVGIYGPIAAYVSVDARQSDEYTVYVTQSGLTLPDREYYLDDENDRFVALRSELKQYVSDMLSFVGQTNPSAAASQIFKLETEIAKNHWSKTENRDPVKTYNQVEAKQLVTQMAGFPWAAFAEAAGVGAQSSFVIRQPSFIEAFGKLFAATDIEVLKLYLKFHLIDRYASSLSEEIEKRSFDFHSTAVRGVDQQRPMWKRGVAITGGALGELVGQLYVAEQFQPEAKSRMKELVGNLEQAFASRIETRDWMGENTKKEALKKLSMFTTKIGYPDQWKDYENLSIDSDILATNMIAAARFETQRELNKLGGPIDRTEWHMTPQTVNAYYNPTMNEIVFPAAILQPPFFNMLADDAVNYGGIGAVIGHELSHGFDDKGSKFDGQGNLRMWWTEQDRQEFERRAKGLVDQYGKYEPIDGNFVNGELTLGENIGDLGGLSVAYEAYRLSLGGKEAPVIDGLTGDQRFFLGWAQIWRRLYRDRELLDRLITDPHSPSEYRANGIVRNLDAWYEAFDITEESDLYLKPENRVRIW